MSTLRSGLAFAFVMLGSLTIFSSPTCAAQSSAGEVPAAQFRIAGTVVSTAGGGTLARTRVTIRDAKNPKDVQSLLTGQDGRFEFHVKAGKYALQGAKRGFITANYDQHEQFSTAIVTGAGLDTESILLKLAPSAVLSGRILDESGEPVRHTEVTLWREDHSTGVSRIVRFRRDIADDQGAYEFTPLDGGNYFLSATATPWYAVHPATVAPEGIAVTPAMVDRALDVVYPTTYYAGATESEDATPIPIRGGDCLELDLHLVPVPALHLVFRGQPSGENRYTMPILQKRVFEGLDRPRGRENSQMIAPGVFELTTEPGKYTVHLLGPGGNSRINEVDISQDHQEVDTSSGEAVSNINASVHVQGEDTLPKELFVALRDEQRRVADYQLLSSQGEVAFANVAPGTYDLVAGSQNDSYSVVRIASDGHETSGHSLKVPAGSSLSLSLTLMGGSGRVEGVAKHAGKAVAGAMVVLVPRHPEANRDLFRRDQSDLDGSFLLQSVIPGTYTVIAIADGWALDWSRPGVILKYASHGQTLVVPGQGSHSIQLPDPVEVQPK
ncbi:MAG: hypothetical protein WA628_05210 [Terriglobales bacterium]